MITWNQDEAELAKFLFMVNECGVRSYLEVGCRNGDTFMSVMKTIGLGGFGLAIDLPENKSARQNLSSAVASLMECGIEAQVVFGDCSKRDVLDYAEARSPFDLVLIDADHRYEAVKRDFGLYGAMANIVALHDVAAPEGHESDGYPNGVGQFWSEIKDSAPSEEFIADGSNMGFGILYRVRQ